ncbi:MAG TPA: hypothetical protein VGC25_11115 [Alphaproteobacteria bacterium]
MSIKRILAIVAIAVVAVVAGALVYLYLNFSGIVKAGVETHGPRYTRTEVRLGGVSVSLFGGEIGISDFFVGNPEGFKAPHAFRVGTVRVLVDRDSITSDVIRIREIVIDAPDIVYELGGANSNLQTIQRNVSTASGASASKGQGGAEGQGPKVIIDNLYVTNAKAAVSAGVMGGEVVPVPVPNLHLKDIGKEKQGATMGEATKQVMDAVTGSVTKAASAIDLDSLRKGAEELGRGAGEAVGGAAKGTEGAVDDVTKGVKGLFGN